MYVPSRRNPIAISSAPDSSVATISPSTPCRPMVAATSTMNAPAGPPIWNRLPESSDTTKPPTMAV